MKLLRPVYLIFIGNLLIMTVKKDILITFSLFLYGFFFSYHFLPFRTSGDAVHYYNAYLSVGDYRSLFDAYIYGYRQYLDSTELIHFLFYYFSSNIGLPKFISDSFLNGVLYFLLYKILFFLNKSSIISLVLVVTSYYAFALMFTLEKLKIAYLFFFILTLYILKYKRINYKLLFAVLLSHFQFFILLFSYFSYLKINSRTLAFLFSLTSIVIVFFLTHIFGKFDYYYGNGSIQDLITVLFFGLMVSSMLRFDYRFIFMVIILSFFSYLIGSERIFIFIYFIFLFVASYKFKYGLYLLLLSIPYSLLKSWVYLSNIYYFGG